MNKTYQNKDIGITLEMPFTWQATYNQDIPLILIAPMEKGFRANMSIIVTPLENATLEALKVVRDAAREDRIAKYADFELVSDESYSNAQMTGSMELFRWTTDDTKKPVTQLFALLLTGTDEMVSVHGTCLTKLEDKYLSRFREVIDSLHFDDVIESNRDDEDDGEE